MEGMKKRFAIATAAVLATLLALPAVSPAAVRSSQSGWSWGNPRPQGNNLNALDFAGGRGYAIGDFGTIIRTDDGGANWSGIKSRITSDLSKLRVIDADTFVAGGGCTLLRSINGGTTLRSLRFNPSANCVSPLSTLAFPTKDIGYLFRSDNSVLRTDDGGARFVTRTAVPGTGGGPPNDAAFTGPDTGVVVTGTDTLGKVFRTTDGGQSWNEGATSQALRGVHFVSPTTGYAVGQNAVLKTTDGGQIWVPQGSPAQPLRSVRCADEMHCVVVTTQNVVMYTDDGFGSLQAATTTTTGATSVTGLAAAYASATRAVAVGGTGITWLSDDAGKSFVRSSGNVPGNYRRLRLTSPSAAFAPGSAGLVALTVDSGQTWGTTGVPTSGADIVDVAFPTAGLGYALDTQGAVFRTDNGGGSWAILGEARPGVRPSAMTSSADGGIVTLFGSFGALRSANAGENFDPVEVDIVTKARPTDFDRAGGAVFAYGTRAIVVTTNEGATWTSVKRPGRGAIDEVDFVDANNGFALTSDGRVWRTTNRGRSWTDLFTLGRTDAYELAFGDRNNGYLAITQFLGFDGGWVLRTQDGGKSWRPQLIERGQIGAEGLVAAPGSVGYALVPGADFFATDSGGNAGEESTLTIASKTKRLPKKGKVAVTGKLSPTAAGSRVEVAMRQFNSAGWKRQTATVRSDGTFTINWTVSRTSYFVAQWDGDQQRTGDGSGALKVVVGRK
jgi:photosystem II stability/assembly factor-like uncharacterized protein